MPQSKAQYNLATANEVLREHQRVLINLARDAADAADLSTYLDLAVQRVAAAIEIDHVKVLRYRPQSNDLFVEAGVGWSSGIVKAAKGISEKAPSDGSGRKLIRALTDQVRGRFDLSSTSAGTTLEVQFFPRHATLPS